MYKIKKKVSKKERKKESRVRLKHCRKKKSKNIKNNKFKI